MVQSNIVRNSTREWHSYFESHFVEHKHDILKSIDDLVELSCQIGPHLSSLKTTVSSLYSPLAQSSLPNVQSLVFDSFFPFWYRKDVSRIVLRR